MKKVLLVDYDENHLRELRKILEGFDVKVDEAKTGTAGFEKLKKGDYALIIASTILPGINGFELTRKIRIELGESKLPVILVSSVYKGARYKYDALHVYGADHFYEFPLDEKDFFATLKKYLPEKAPTTTMRMETLHGKPMEETWKPEKEEKLITTDELFGDILEEVEKEMVESREEPEEEEREEIIEEVPPRQEEVPQPEDILKEILEPSPPRKKIPKKKEEDFIDKILEETLSGLVEEKPARKKPQKEVKKAEEKAVIEEKPVEVEEEIREKGKIEEPEEIEEVEEEAKSEEEIEEVREVLEEEAGVELEEEPFGPLEEQPVLGEYILLEKISTGGMAEVYKAKKKGVKGFEKIVALKKILPHLAEDEEFIEMFIDEAKVASKLNHPNIAQIYDLGKINGSYFIAMEYVLGKDLRTILKKIRKEKKALPPVEISSYIIMKVAEALDYAHRKVDEKGKPLNIVHRDVSPQNILISYEGEIKLVDFGVAKASIRAHHTVAGSLKGKLLYMSPEQAKGAKTLDGRSDIFSLGTVYYELVTGEKAFLAQSEAEVLDRVKKGKFKPPRAIRPDLPAEVERIILKAMEPDPSRRYQRASEMRNDIEKFLLSYKGYIPSARDVAEFMYGLFEDEIKKAGIDVQILKAPERKVKVEKKEEIAEKKEVKVPSFGLEEEERKKSSIFPIILIIILLVAGGAGAFFFLGKGKKTTPPPEEEKIAQQIPEAPKAQEAVSQQPSPQQAQETVSQEQPSAQQPAQPATGSVQPPSPTKTTSTTRVQPVSRKTATTPKPAVRRPTPPAKKSPVTRKKVPKTAPITPSPKPAQKVQAEVSKPAQPAQKPQPKPQETKPPAPAPKPESAPQAKTQTPKPQPQPVIREGDVVPYPLLDSKPRPVRTVSPTKPRFPNLSGIVFLSVLVGPDGRVEQIKLIRGIHPRYNEQAIKAVRKWKFTSPMKQGKRVRTWTTVTIKF